MPPKSEHSFEVNLPFEKAMALTKLALWEIGANIFPGELEQGVVLGRTGISFRSYGENIRVQVSPSGDKSKVYIHSQSSWPAALADWGKNHDNAKGFEQKLRTLSRFSNTEIGTRIS